MSAKIEHDSINDKAYDIISNEILSGIRKTGDRLTIEKLANEMGVSSTPIRDAIKRLESEGLVSVLARKGTFVSLPTIQEIHDLFQFRTAMETFAVSEAMPNFTKTHLINLRKSIERAKSSQNAEDFIQADREFHGTIVACANNIFLTETAERINRRLRFIRSVCAIDHSFDNKVVDEHEAILKAIASKDVEGATDKIKKHLTSVMEQTLLVWPSENSIID